MKKNNLEKVHFISKASLCDTMVEISDTDVLIKSDSTTITLERQKDLLYMVSIMLSVGQNRNDDVFLAEEVLPVRNTAKNKPLNIEHSEADIIGHILESYVTLKNGDRIDNDKDPETNDFDITASSVIYKYLLPQVAADIREKAEAGKLFVSVEAWFSDYDYLVGSKIIKRNDETAGVLDSILRSRGGDGVYKGQKVGRVLRNILLGGMGIVKNPANPESVIKSISKVEASDVFIDDAIINQNTIGDLNMEKAVATEKVEQKVEAQGAVAVVATEPKVEVKVEVKEEEKVEAKNTTVTPEQAKEIVAEAKSAAPEVPPTPKLMTAEEVKSLVDTMEKAHADALAKKDNEVGQTKATYEAVVDATKKLYEEAQAKVDAALKELAELRVENEKLISALKALKEGIEAKIKQEEVASRKSVFMKELGFEGEMLEKHSNITAAYSQEEFQKYISNIKELMSYNINRNKENETIKTEASVTEKNESVPSVEEMKKIDTPLPIVTETPQKKNGEQIAHDALAKFLAHSPRLKKFSK